MRRLYKKIPLSRVLWSCEIINPEGRAFSESPHSPGIREYVFKKALGHQSPCNRYCSRMRNILTSLIARSVVLIEFSAEGSPLINSLISIGVLTVSQ